MKTLNASRFTKSSLAAAAAMAAVSGASAATISWSGDNAPEVGDISTVGTLVEAVNVVTADSQVDGVATANGVDFVDTNLFGNGYAGLNPSLPSFGDAGLDSLYANFGYTAAQDVTITGLVAGQDYLIQVLYGDNRGCCNGRTGGIGTTIGSGVDISGFANATGVIYTGTFTADAATQTFYTVLNDGTNDLGTEISAYQVRLVPEPSSLALVGLGGLLVARRRRG